MKTSILPELLFIMTFVLFLIVGLFIFSIDSEIIIKNNSNRNYKYEHYYDSIYEVNPDYYLDVLVETNKFQNYIDKHGEWWNN